MISISRSQIQEASRIIQENVSEEDVLDMNRRNQFRHMISSISSGNIASFVRAKTYLDQNCPEFNYYEVYQRKDADSSSMFHNACLNQRCPLARFIMQDTQKSQMNARNIHGNTPLHLMIMNVAINKRFNKDLFDILMDNGANILLRDSNNRTVEDFLSLFEEDFLGKEYILDRFRKERSKETKLNLAFVWQFCQQDDSVISKISNNELIQIMKFI